jgi:penicillin-binding protein 2
MKTTTWCRAGCRGGDRNRQARADPGHQYVRQDRYRRKQQVIDGKVYKLKNHSIFACFAPRENPKIAVAVIVENGGFGADAAGPIASLLVEKYLNDTIATDRLELEDRMTNRTSCPATWSGCS